MDSSPYVFQYEFFLDSGETLELPIQIHPETLNLIAPVRDAPDWTRLTHHQCDCCSLNVADYPNCPAALNIVSFIQETGHFYSTASCVAQCKSPLRTTRVSKKIMIQDGLASALFLMLIASECPVLGLLKPLIKSHLPFVSVNEVVLRVTSTLMLGFYFKSRKENPSQATAFQDFNSRLKAFSEVYYKLVSRVKKLSQKDANLNAFVIIESMNRIISMEMDENLNSLEHLFASWLV